MAEAIAFVGLVSAVTTLTETGFKIIRRIKDAKDSIGAFDHIANQLPLLLELIEPLKSESLADAADQSSGSSLLRAVEGCQRQIKQLEELLDSCSMLATDGRARKFIKAVKQTQSEKKIRSIQDTLEGYKTTLILFLGKPTPSKSTLSSAEHRFVKLPALQVSCFVGRDELIRDLIKALVPSEPPTVICLHAMGGQGKTQVALECCRQLQRSQAFQTIIWIDATSKGTMNAEFNDLLKELAKNAPSSLELDKVGGFQQVLEDWPEPYLLIFDNCDRPAALQAVKECLPSNPNGVTLCTSRHLDSDRLGQVISVPPMSVSEASELLLSRCKAVRTDGNVAEASEITKMLGFLPLAVDQAGSYIKRRRLPLTAFLEHYRIRKDSILKHVPDVWEYRKSQGDDEKKTSLSVFTTYELALGELDREDDDSHDVAGFLSFLAFFHYREIPELLCQSHAQRSGDDLSWISRFLVDGHWDSGRYQDLAAKLLANSLITSMDFQGKETSISLHPLVQTWARLRLSRSEQQQSALTAISAIGLLFGARKIPFEVLLSSSITEHLFEASTHIHLFPSIKGDNASLDSLLDNVRSFRKLVDGSQLEDHVMVKDLQNEYRSTSQRSYGGTQ